MMNILHPTQVCPICPCWCFPVVQHMAPGSCRNEQQDVSSAALLGWWLLLRPTGSTAILISTLWFHLWGKISCIFPCFVLLFFFNCLAHYSQLIDQRNAYPQGMYWVFAHELYKKPRHLWCAGWGALAFTTIYARGAWTWTLFEAGDAFIHLDFGTQALGCMLEDDPFGPITLYFCAGSWLPPE